MTKVYETIAEAINEPGLSTVERQLRKNWCYHMAYGTSGPLKPTPTDEEVKELLVEFRRSTTMIHEWMENLSAYMGRPK